ncbi:MAG: peroxiredoxin [Chlamydiae bacterium]|jgi:peroxiredoxin (alkyl hydroperoxide reductase subunit C)|nr:peroxiredoxin [Chlamydiota bacterium]NDD99677.1 peroxiredoxin [bacterium]
MTTLIGYQAPNFVAQAVKKGEIIDVQLKDYKGKFVVLLFYPMDFTFVCPTELLAFEEKIAEFHKRNCEVMAISTDSVYTHRAWWNHEIKRVSFPIVSDITKTICLNYGTLIDKGISLRGTFIIDTDGLVEHMSINNLGIGRGVNEVLRLVDAIQYHKSHGEVCPADWHSGDKGIVPK